MKNFKLLKTLLVLIGILIGSINTAWAVKYQPTKGVNGGSVVYGVVPQGAVMQSTGMQSQQMMSGGAYSGTVYEPFTNTTPSEANNPAKTSGPRRAYDKDGNWVPDAQDMEYAGDTERSEQSPIGEPWVMALFAVAFAGVIAIRQYKRKTVKSMNMKNSTSKFIATLALLCTLSVGQIWGWKFNYPCLYFNNSQGWDKVMMLMYYHNNEEATQGFDFTHIDNTNLWYCRATENRGESLSGYAFGLAEEQAKNYSWKCASGDGCESWNNRWGWLKGHCNDHHTGDSQSDLLARTYYITTTGTSNISVTDKYVSGEDGNYPNRIDKYTAELKVRISEDGGSTYGAALTSGTWPGTLNLQGTYITLSVDNDHGSAPTSGRSSNGNVNSGSGDSYSAVVTGLITMTLVSTDDAAYEFVGWGTGDAPAYTGDEKEYNITANTTYYAFFKRKQFAVTFEPKGTYGESTVTAAISTTPLTSGSSYNYGSAITFTATPAAGYKLNPSQAWYSDAACNTSLGNGTSATYSVASLTSAQSVYVKFVAKQSAITFSQSGAGYASGTPASNTATYGEAMTSITPPVANTGYKFQGYFDGENGTGTQYYDASGNSARNWDKDKETGTTLYAYFEKAHIDDLTFSPLTSAGDTKVEITPYIAPNSWVGTLYIHWKLYKDVDCTHEVTGSAFKNAAGESALNPSTDETHVSFVTPSAAGNYYIQAILRVGNTSASTKLDSVVYQYIVASDHTVTVRYMCDGVAIHAPTEVVVPAAGAAGVKALSGDDVFGYKFDSWSLGEGLDNECVDGSVCGTSKDSINISAIFNGTLTANYTKKNMIYFKNEFNWANVYVHLLGSSYWDSSNGTGNNGRTNRNLQMSLVPGTTDVYAYEYGNKTCSFVVFTDRSYDAWDVFHEPDGSKDPAPIVYPRVRSNADNSGDCADFDFNAGVPMFVPLAGQTGDKKYGNKAIYYNKGYWRKYEPATGKTGYYLEIFNKPDADGRKTLYRLDMTDASTSGDVFEVTIDLEGKKAYGIKVLRDNDYGYTNTTQDLASYDGSTYTTISKQSASNWKAIPLVTNTAGDYTFKLTCGNSDGNLKLAVKKPAATSDYRVLYSDDTHNTARTKRFSRTITKLANAEDIVSFFVDVDKHPAMTFESIYSIAGDGSVTWTDGADLTISSIKTSGVYNFYLKQDGNGAISLDKIEPYTGDFYIRTDAVGGTKWADYCNIAHQMSYSEYSKDNAGYTHYWMKHLNGSDNVNVKFVVANDYSAWISDTVIQQSPEVAHINASGVNSGDVSIRFSYNALTNEAKRTYLANSTANDFLVLKNNATASSNNVKVGGVDKSGVDVKFTDNQNYIYDITAQVVPSANVRVKVYAHYNTTDQNLIGDVSVGTYNDDTDSKSLLSGTVASLQSIRVLYDFKTNRLVTAWEPTGSTITEELDIDADLMIIREHQEAAQNIVLGHDDIKKTDGKIVTEKRIYGVMRFNRWILNNLSNPNDKSDAHAGSDYLTYHAPLSIGQQLPTYQRNLYYISFPFDVKVSEIFGFGTYGTHFAIQRYDGAGRAKSGYWIDSDPNWKWVPPTGTLNAFEGYVLSLSLSNMAASNTTVWANKTSEVELYFPSTTEGVTIETTDVVIPALSDEDYKCSIERDSRNVKDSYWRCIGVPCYANYSDELLDAEDHTITWQTADETLPFIYDINWQDKSLTAYAGDNFPFKAMHSYLVQYKGAIKWQQTSAEAAGIVARTKKQSPTEYTFRLELNKNEAFCDQTFVRLSDKEDVTNGYDFDNDLWKQLYSSRSNIYTRIGDVNVAGNVLPINSQTTIVPVGVTIAEDGDYTFAMPEGTNGVGVVLIDTITGTRTNLALTDYTVNLTAGTYDGRFSLELSPIADVPSGIEQTGADVTDSVRKVMVDGILYIVKDGKVFDARGNRVQ